MGIFDFMSEGVEEAVAGVQAQIQRAEEMMADLRNVVAPLEQGGWIGEGAQAFFEDSRQMLAHMEQTRDHLQAFHQALMQTQQKVMETQQQVISHIGS